MVIVSVDRLVLREAVTNIVDNAVKYSPRGSTITIRVHADRDRACLEIVDQGSGIALEYRGRIFNRFFRVDEGRSRESGETGLGLAIAKWAVEVNSSQISVESGASGGSVFQISLPRIAASIQTTGRRHARQRTGEHV